VAEGADVIYDSKRADGTRDFEAFSLDGLHDTVERTAADLWKHRNEFDSIVCIGMSGVVVATPVALKLNKPVVILRKPEDDSHQGLSKGGIINSDALGSRALLVDDFSSSGDTERGVIERVGKLGAKVVATYWYRDSEIVHHAGHGSHLPSPSEVPF
jgi:adenine/guanine phosphoribosyltransferase-like PRPP-binding protein